MTRLEKELERILNNLTFKGNTESESGLIDLKVIQKKEKLLQIIDSIKTKSDLQEKVVEVIDQREIAIFKQILKDEINTIQAIQEAVLANDDKLYEKIFIQKQMADYSYQLINLNDAIYKFDNVLCGLFMYFKGILVNIFQNDESPYSKVKIIEGDIYNIASEEMNPSYYLLMGQLNNMINCYNLDTIRKELVNIVKIIIFKTEKE